jgi:hypothetical protein
MSISLALVFPCVLLIVMLTVQGALWWYDRQVALGAARQGSEVAAGVTAAGQGGAGSAEALDWMRRYAGGAGQQRAWTRVRGDLVMVYAHLRVPGVLGGFFPLSVTVSVSAPLEKFTRAGT